MLEVAGFDAIHGILDCYWKALSCKHHNGYRQKLLDMMPSTLKKQVEAADSMPGRLRIVVDFVAAMTDEYAVRFRNEILGMKLP